MTVSIPPLLLLFLNRWERRGGESAGVRACDNAREGKKDEKVRTRLLYHFDVVDHPVHDVRLAHERRYVQPAQAEQGGVEKELRQLACPQHPADVVDQSTQRAKQKQHKK